MENVELDVWFEDVNHVVQFRTRFKDAIIDIDDNEFDSKTLRCDYKAEKVKCEMYILKVVKRNFRT